LKFPQYFVYFSKQKTKMTAPLTLHVDLMSQPARTVHWFCKLNSIPHDVKLWNIAKGEHKTAEYKNVHPFNRIPAIQDKGLNVFESHTILKYLAQEYRNLVPDHWYPQDFKRRIKIDEYLDWHHLNARKAASSLFASKFLFPKSGRSVSEETIKTLEKETKQALDDMENYWLRDTVFIAGPEPSIADLSSYSEWAQLKTIKYDFTKNVKVFQWMKKMEALPHYQDSFVILHKVLAKL